MSPNVDDPAGDDIIEEILEEDEYEEVIIEDEDEFVEELVLDDGVEDYVEEDASSVYTEESCTSDGDHHDVALASSAATGSGGKGKRRPALKTVSEKISHEKTRQQAPQEANNERANVLYKQQQQHELKQSPRRDTVNRDDAVETSDNPRAQQARRISQREGEKVATTQVRRAYAAQSTAPPAAASQAERDAQEESQRVIEQQRLRLEEEARILQAKVEEARKATLAAKVMEEEEKKRLKVKLKARRNAAKSLLLQANQAVKTGADAPPPMFAAANRAAVNKMSKEEEAAQAAAILDVVTEYYTVDQLRTQSVPDLDYKNREKYLSPSDFAATFGCTKEDWAAWPKWKRVKAKRAVKLF
jgi:hypothetical protein